MICEYASKYYGVPAEIGRRVTVYGKPGIIAADRGHYIGVNFDESKPGHISNCHPEDGVIYLEMGTIRKMTKSQENYQRFLDADCGETFREWMGFKKKQPAYMQRLGYV